MATDAYSIALISRAPSGHNSETRSAATNAGTARITCPRPGSSRRRWTGARRRRVAAVPRRRSRSDLDAPHLPLQALNEILKASAQGQEYGGRCRAGASGRRERAQPANQAPAAVERRGELRGCRPHAELVAASGVYAAEKRVDQALKRLAAEAAPDELADRDVLIGRAGGDDHVQPGPGESGGREDARPHERSGSTRHTGHQARRQRAQLVGPHERLVARRRDQLVAEPDLAAEIDAGGNAGE